MSSVNCFEKKINNIFHTEWVNKDLSLFELLASEEVWGYKWQTTAINFATCGTSWEYGNRFLQILPFKGLHFSLNYPFIFNYLPQNFGMMGCCLVLFLPYLIHLDEMARNLVVGRIYEKIKKNQVLKYYLDYSPHQVNENYLWLNYDSTILQTNEFENVSKVYLLSVEAGPDLGNTKHTWLDT